METIAKIIIINSQDVQSEHLSAVFITSVFKEESSISIWTSSTGIDNTVLLELPLNNLKSLRHWLAELHVIQVIAWNINVYSFCIAIFDAHTWSYYMVTATK